LVVCVERKRSVDVEKVQGKEQIFPSGERTKLEIEKTAQHSTSFPPQTASNATYNVDEMTNEATTSKSLMT